MNYILPYLDILSKVATVLIAALNLFFAIKFFQFKTKKDDADKENDRRIQWLKSLILDHNLKHFYEFFEMLDIELYKLKQNGLSDENKKEIDSKIAEQFIFLRRKFIDILLAVDSELYEFFITSSDDLQDHFTNAIFDQGINLAHQSKFDEVISEKLMKTKTEFIKKLFNYRG